MRKISAGLRRHTATCVLTLKGWHQAGSPVPQAHILVIPKVLIRLLRLRTGQRLKAQASGRGVVLQVLRIPSVVHRFMPRKRSGAQRVLFERRWQQALRTLERDPRQRHAGRVNKRRRR